MEAVLQSCGKAVASKLQDFGGQSREVRYIHVRLLTLDFVLYTACCALELLWDRLTWVAFKVIYKLDLDTLLEACAIMVRTWRST